MPDDRDTNRDTNEEINQRSHFPRYFTLSTIVMILVIVGALVFLWLYFQTR